MAELSVRYSQVLSKMADILKVRAPPGQNARCPIDRNRRIRTHGRPRLMAFTPRAGPM